MSTFQVHRDAAGKRKRMVCKTRSGPVYIQSLDREGWRTALRLANGDATRITVVSRTEFVVHNN